MKRAIGFAAVLLIATCIASAQHVSWQPSSPRVGDAVTFRYDSRIGPLGPATATIWMHWGVLDPLTGTWSTPPQSIWPQGSRLHSDNVAVQSPMTPGLDSIRSVTIDFDTTIQDIAFVFTDGTSQWDNNNGDNWILNFLLPGTVSWWTPDDAQPGDILTIYYDAVPGTLPNAATSATLHWGVNEAGHGNWRLPPQGIWPPGTVPVGSAAQTPMTSMGGGLFRIVIATTDSIYSLHYVITDGTNWDNNGTANWNILLTEPLPLVYTHRIFRYDPRSAFATQFSGSVNSLNLAGTFNGWSTGANPLTNIDMYGNRWGEVRMPVGTCEYKFVINGNNWQTDPDNPHTAAGGYNNSVTTVAVDSFPQVYDIQPGENRIFNNGSSVTVSVKIRPGDLGPGLSGTPVARVDGAVWPATWNALTSQLTLNALPQSTSLDVTITASDSAGRSRTRHLAYGFRSGYYLGVDPIGDVRYLDGSHPSANWDLLRLVMSEFAGGDSIAVTIGFQSVSTSSTMAVITISGTNDGFGPIPGLSSEVNVPGLTAGGVSLLLLSPTSPYYDAAIHNRLHPSGDLSQTGPTVQFSSDLQTFTVGISKADLEAYLGSYQTAWYYTCASYAPASAQNGYCEEITANMGGVEGTEEPDAFDVLFMQATDIESKMLLNYGLTRRATMDAPGRGVAAVTPQEIGPNIPSEGPVCRILTRGAPTMDNTQNVVGRITSSVAVGNVWLTQNQSTILVGLSGDSFTVATTLAEGENVFTLWAVDSNQDTGRSPTMTFTLVVDHAPNIQIATRVESGQGVLDASATTDPEQQTVSFLWETDAANPAPVTLLNANAAVSQFALPAVPGEYYFNLTATDPDQHSTNARTFFTVYADSTHGFSNNECADWVKSAIIYEIFPRSFSSQGNLDGITADLPRLADLGVNCIWMMPIFEGPSDHGYEITDYYAIEQDYGTAEDLHELVQTAHSMGIKIILDMVLNHTGIGHPFMQDAMRYGRYSHYWDWYDRDANGNYTYYYDWTSLPNINLNNPETVKYYIDMCKYWITEFDIDGYRCDVAWGPQQRSPQFWVQWRQALKEIKPECLLLAENGANDFVIFNNRFDLAFDWNLHHEGAASFANMFPQIPNFTQLNQLVTNYGVWWPPYKNPLRFMENHDEARFISLNTAPQTKLVSSFMMCLPGTVMLYAGQEIGTTSQRGIITWGVDPNGMYPHYYRLTNARKLLPALRTGSFTLLDNNQSGSCYSFARYGANMDPVIFVGDFSPSSAVVTMTLNLPQLGLHADSTYIVTELLSGSYYSAQGSQLASLLTSLSSYQSRVWVVSDSVISVDVPPAQPPLPQKTELGAAYPNPFNPVTTLPLELSSPVHVTLRIFDVLGREVATIMDAPLQAGVHQIVWDSRLSGHEVGSGIYFAVMQAGRTTQVRKLVLLK